METERGGERRTAAPPRVRVVTYGCKINQYDSQAMREQLATAGFARAAAGEAADAVVINACAVTARAGEKAVAAARRAVRQHPGSAVVVTGCLAPGERERVAAVSGVQAVVGNDQKHRIGELLDGATPAAEEGRRSREILRLSTSVFEGQTRAFLKIQDGCDDFCTYCVIPFLRGKSKSRESSAILEEAARLARAGHRELVVTGIHLSTYGRDLSADECTLVELLRRLRQVPGVDRLRLSSLGPSGVTAPLLDLFRDDPGQCRFFHLPIQSGSDRILRGMRRAYTAGEFLSAVERLRAVLPDAVVATDLMVGFPGESDRDFEESLATCRRAGFAFLHLFPYSPRRGTRAAQMSGVVPPEIVRERMQRARRLDAELQRAEGRRRLGVRVRVLVESQHPRSVIGLSREGLRVRVEMPRGGLIGDLRNREVWAEVVGAEGRTQVAELRPDGAGGRSTRSRDSVGPPWVLVGRDT